MIQDKKERMQKPDIDKGEIEKESIVAFSKDSSVTDKTNGVERLSSPHQRESELFQHSDELGRKRSSSTLDQRDIRINPGTNWLHMSQFIVC